MVVDADVRERLLEIRNVLIHRRRLLPRPELEPRDPLDEYAEMLGNVEIAVDRDALAEVIVVVRVGRHTETRVGEVLEPLAQLAPEAQVRLGIIGIERDVLDGVERIRPIPRVREVRVVLVEAKERIGWGIRIGWRLGIVLGEH